MLITPPIETGAPIYHCVKHREHRPRLSASDTVLFVGRPGSRIVTATRGLKSGESNSGDMQQRRLPPVAPLLRRSLLRGISAEASARFGVQ